MSGITWMGNNVLDFGVNSIPTNQYPHRLGASLSKQRNRSIPIKSHTRLNPSRNLRNRLRRQNNTMVAATRSTTKPLTLGQSPSIINSTPTDPYKAPLASPQLWMDPDYDINRLSVKELRTILEFNSVKNEYCRKFQQVLLFKEQIWPRVVIIRERYSNDISNVSDDQLLKEILALPPLVGQKRTFKDEDEEVIGVDSGSTSTTSELRPIKKLRVQEQ